MRKEVADKLTAALRSGEYKQGNGYLCKLRTSPDDVVEGQYCCLGVLVDIYMKETNKDPDTFTSIQSYVQDEEETGLCRVYSSGKDKYYLPEEVQEWAGMITANGTLPTLEIYESTSLAGLNDTGHYTFEAIAAIVDKEWATL